jgi:predicted anti-sigma-YlaC factor YlaD
MVKEYRDQVERERREKVLALLSAAVAGKLSSITALLVETHCANCRECKEYFDWRAKAGNAAGPPGVIEAHVARLMESLPPDEEFFLA